MNANKNQMTDQVPENSPSLTAPIKQNSPDEEIALFAAQDYELSRHQGGPNHLQQIILAAFAKRDLLRRVKAGQVEARSGFGEVHGPTRPRIHNKKMLDAIEAVVLEHSGNEQLAESVRKWLSAEASEVVEEEKQDFGEPGAV